MDFYSLCCFALLLPEQGGHGVEGLDGIHGSFREDDGIDILFAYGFFQSSLDT